ncbi:MAG: 50S ribosomal protein L11 methyltransferase [Desulfovibrio sp.]|jgi:ribosomal protein L11 methyltransferase|nr:50S ribosomal protein L11 methyltransferase [Desulfovibrio sp.]
MPLLTRFEVSLPPGHAKDEEERVGALLALRVAQGWEEENRPDGSFVCTAYFVDGALCPVLADELQFRFPQVTITQSACEEKNWLEAWKEFFTPVECGRHFLVLAPWMEEAKKRTSRIPLIIQPGTAFGTGHHASTALCLEALSEVHAAGRVKRGTRFLDLGTGSGILGMAAAKLGLVGDGLDVDPEALANARENLRLNGLDAERLNLRKGGIEAASGRYGLIMANILAGPLMDMAPRIAALGGEDAPPLLILSGILEEQSGQVEEAYRSRGCPAPRVLGRGEWVALIFDPGSRAERCALDAKIAPEYTGKARL